MVATGQGRVAVPGHGSGGQRSGGGGPDGREHACGSPRGRASFCRCSSPSRRRCWPLSGGSPRSARCSGSWPPRCWPAISWWCSWPPRSLPRSPASISWSAALANRPCWWPPRWWPWRSGRAPSPWPGRISDPYLLLLAVAVAAVSAIYGGRWLVAAMRKPPRAGFGAYVAPLAAAELANALLQRAHIFLLGGLAGPKAVALFAAAEELGRPAAAVRYVFDPIAAVAIAECFRLADRERLRYNVRLITRWVASAAAPIAATLIVLRGELLSLYGPTFGPASTAMVLMVGTHLSNSVLGIGAGILPVVGRPGRFLVSNLIACRLERRALPAAHPAARARRSGGRLSYRHADAAADARSSDLPHREGPCLRARLDQTVCRSGSGAPRARWRCGRFRWRLRPVWRR